MMDTRSPPATSPGSRRTSSSWSAVTTDLMLDKKGWNIHATSLKTEGTTDASKQFIVLAILAMLLSITFIGSVLQKCVRTYLQALANRDFAVALFQRHSERCSQEVG